MDLEGEGTGLDLALRAKEADHAVRYWLPPHVAGDRPYGEGLVNRPEDWEPLMDWADLVVLCGNSKYENKLSYYFGKGYPIFGANAKSAELELDRQKGQELLESVGIETLPYAVVGSAEEGVDYITREGKPFVMKPWGGTADKAMTHVASTPDEAVFILEKWEREGKFTGELMLQEKADGIEIGVSGMFGPGGWCRMIEESFEHKKFMNDDLGENTGEQGTVIAHTSKSLLFDKLLKPLTDHLQLIGYTGDCSVNCIVDKDGRPWPLEFTMRLGWPDFTIRQEVLLGDPVGWMLDLLKGKDSFDVSEEVALGVVMSHGDFPRSKDPLGTWAEYPIKYKTKDWPHLHWQEVKWGSAPRVAGGAVVRRNQMLTAGNYVVVVTGAGETVTAAHRAAYAVVGDVKWPSNVMYRTDIGKRLEAQLPVLHKLGYAKGIIYG